jgi:hypothetical protein
LFSNGFFQGIIGGHAPWRPCCQVTRRLAWLRHLELLAAMLGAGMWMVWKLRKLSSRGVSPGESQFTSVCLKMDKNLHLPSGNLT